MSRSRTLDATRSPASRRTHACCKFLQRSPTHSENTGSRARCAMVAKGIESTSNQFYNDADGARYRHEQPQPFEQ